MEVEEQEPQQFKEKRTINGEEKAVALDQEVSAQDYRFAHFDVNPEHWFFTDRISDGRSVLGACYRCRQTGRPIFIVPAPDATHYVLYIQVRADTPQGTAPYGFILSPGDDVGLRMSVHLNETREVYANLGELQAVPYEEIDEAEQVRFLSQIKRGIVLKQLTLDLKAQLPPEQVQVPVENRRTIRGHRRLGKNRK